MSTKNTGGPAFPATSWTKDGDFLGDNQGMTLRDYFAAKAMVGHAQALANWACSSEKEWHAEVARVSYATADAMLAAREAK